MIPQGCYIVDDQRRVGIKGSAVAFVLDDGHGNAFLTYVLGEGSDRIRIEDDDPSYIGEEHYFVLPTGDGTITLRWPDVKLFDELATEFPEMAWPHVASEDQAQAFLRSITIDVYPGP